MKHTSFRSGGGSGVKCSRCRERLYDVEVDGVALCEECLTRAVHASSGNKRAADDYEIRQLEGEITRLTGHSVRNLKHLPAETVTELRRAVRNIEQEKHGIKSKLRRYGLPGM